MVKQYQTVIKWFHQTIDEDSAFIANGDNFAGNKAKITLWQHDILLEGKEYYFQKIRRT